MHAKELSEACSGESHRDCDLLQMTGPLSQLELQYRKESDGSEWRITFKNIYAFRMVSEEFVSNEILSITSKSRSIYTISSSRWIKEFEEGTGNKIANGQHIIFFFYDEVVEVIADQLIPEEVK